MIYHELADGSRPESIEGHVVKDSAIVETVKNILKNVLEEKEKREIEESA